MSTTLTPRELAALQRSVVEAASQPEKLIDVPELAKALGISRATIDRRIKDGRIPVIRIGRRRRFRLSAVYEALEATT